MSISNPLVSVCIPACNCAAYIQQTLDCLVAQSYPFIEVIVVNDGSTDNTSVIAKGLNNERIQVIDVANGGAARARNIAYSHAKGEYIIFFDADDYVAPDFIEKQIRKIAAKTDVVALAAWGRFYNDIGTFKLDDAPHGEMIFKEWIKRYWYNGNPMTNPGRAIIPSALVKKAGLWNEGLSLNDDLEFFTRLFLNARKIVFNADAVFYYRSGVKGLSSATGLKAYAAHYESLSLSVNAVLQRYNNDPELHTACANMWQLFVYDVYPDFPELTGKAQGIIDNLGGSTLKYPSGKLTNLLARGIGWKNAKKLRSLF